MANLLAVKPLSMLLKEAENEGETGLKRALGPLNLITLGIGAIIGAGRVERTSPRPSFRLLASGMPIKNDTRSSGLQQRVPQLPRRIDG